MGTKFEIIHPFSNNCFYLQSTAMMDSFMKLAKSNTKKNLETCGILAGVLVSAVYNFFVLN